MQAKFIERYFFFGLLLATLLFTFFIFRPFLVVLVLGVSISVVLYPVYQWWLRRRLPAWLAALITLILFIIILCGPLFGIGLIVFNQSQHIYHYVVQGGDAGRFIDSVNASVNKVLPAALNVDLNAKISGLVTLVSSNLTKIFSTTLTAIFSFVLMLLIIFYSLKDGGALRKSIVIISPLGDEDDEKILNRLSRAINGVIKGYLLIALVQGLLMGLGLHIFGVPNWALWGVVAAVCSLIPSIGTGLVSIPAVIYLLAAGHTAAAVGMLAWAALIVGTVDNLLNPIFIGKRVNLHPLLILFSVLGGVAMLGPVGILIGPLTISLMYTLVSIYRNEYRDSAAKL